LALNVVVTDPLPGGLEYVAGSALPVASNVNGVLRWTKSELGVNESMTMTFVTRVLPEPSNQVRMSVFNKAYVSATPPGVDPVPPVVHSSGEFRVPLAPSVVVLTSFTAKWSSDGVSVTWETGSEIDSFGFFLYRSESKDRSQAVRVSDEMIAAQSVNGSGGAYSIVDRGVELGKTYYYWLQEIETDGDALEYGPVGTDGTSITQPEHYKTFLPMIAN
jgi:hypothetical protein